MFYQQLSLRSEVNNFDTKQGFSFLLRSFEHSNNIVINVSIDQAYKNMETNRGHLSSYVRYYKLIL